MKHLTACALLALSVTSAGADAPPAPGYQGVPVLQMPAITSAENSAASLAAAGEVQQAKSALSSLMRRWPRAARPPAMLAALLAEEGQKTEALKAFAIALANGLPDAEGFAASSALSRYADDDEFLTLMTTAPSSREAGAAPFAVSGVDTANALISKDNISWNAEEAWLQAGFEMLPAMRRFPVIEGELKGPWALLQRRVATGHAAGNVGDLYDNRDNNHSWMFRQKPTQISYTEYSAEAKSAGLSYGLNDKLMFNRPTIGNSSTAKTSGPFWRSQPRVALTTPGGAARQAQLYFSNHLYVYPEHRDHDPYEPRPNETPDATGKGMGDLFPANTPYMLISQGSSGSDKPILYALTGILAAFDPKVKAFLTEENLIAPTLQQIFRAGMMDAGEDGYLTAAAHPVVFDGERIDLARMISLAGALKQDEVAPAARIRVLEEPEEGPGFALEGPSQYFDTPAAISRIWRGADYSRRYVLSAEDTKDPNGRDLRFHWVLAHGDAEKVRIRPLNPAGARAEITIDWSSPTPGPVRGDIEGSRIDIALIAENGANYSAPAFFSMLQPRHQKRSYERAGDGAMRLKSVDFITAVRNRAYADPGIWPQRSWTDHFSYNSENQMTGWRREPLWGKPSEFTAFGHLLLEKTEDGRPARAAEVFYQQGTDKSGRPQITWEAGPQLFTYHCAGPQDAVCAPSPE